MTINNLPLAYQCAIEMLDRGERSYNRILGMFDHFEKVYGLTNSEYAETWRADAWAIAKQRYCIAEYPAVRKNEH